MDNKIKVVIDIDKTLFENVVDHTRNGYIGSDVWIAVANGKPYSEPEDGMRLIDADSLKTSRTMALVAEKDAPQNEIAFAPLVCVLKENIDDAPTIVEADKENDNG